MATAATESYPFDTSTMATSVQWAQLFRQILPSGVFPSLLSELIASPVSGQRQVSIANGGAFIDGHYGRWDTASVLAVPANALGAARKDLVVARARRSGGTLQAELDYLTGTTAAFPTLTQTTSVWEIALFQVSPPNGFTELTAPDIVDVRTYAEWATGGGGGGGSGGLPQSFGSSYGPTLLTFRDPGVELATVSTWYAAISNCSIAAETSVVRSGAQSLRARGSAAGTAVAGTLTGTAGIPVTVGTTYRGTFFCRAFSTARVVTPQIRWYTAAGSLISTTSGTAASNVNTGWTSYSVEGEAPATAAFASLGGSVASTVLNEDHFYDDWVFQPKYVSRTYINFVRALVEDDPANNRFNVYPDPASSLLVAQALR